MFLRARAYSMLKVRDFELLQQKRVFSVRKLRYRVEDWIQRFEQKKAEGYGKTSEQGLRTVKRIFFVPIAVWLFIYRYHDIERDLYLPAHPWSEVDMEFGWRGMGLCDCDGNRGFSQVESLAQRMTHRLKATTAESTVIFDLGSGMLLPSYIYAKRIMERCPRVKDINLVISDTAYSEDIRGVYEISQGGITTFTRFDPTFRGIQNLPQTVDFTQLWRPTVLFGMVMLWFVTESFDTCVESLVQELRNTIVQSNKDVTVRVHVFGDVVQPWSQNREKVWEGLVDHTKILAKNAFVTHVHFEGSGMIKPLSQRLKPHFTYFYEDYVPDPFTGCLLMLRGWFNFSRTRKPLKQLPSFNDFDVTVTEEMLS